MEEGFPGKLTTTVEFTFRAPAGDTKNSALHIRYVAETDKPTVLNLTNHAYFNLRGHTGEAAHPTVLDHVLTIAADKFVCVDEKSIPTGSYSDVERTPLDFRKPTRIGENIESPHAQLIFVNGYDHSFAVANGEPKACPEGTPEGMRALGVEVDSTGAPKRTRGADASIVDPVSGRRMETFTEEPAVHLFTNNIPDDVLKLGGKGKHGVESYTYRTGVCFETQHFADNCNQPFLPSCVLRPGNAYTSETVYWFSVDA